MKLLMSDDGVVVDVTSGRSLSASPVYVENWLRINGVRFRETENLKVTFDLKSPSLRDSFVKRFGPFREGV